MSKQSIVVVFLEETGELISQTESGEYDIDIPQGQSSITVDDFVRVPSYVSDGVLVEMPVKPSSDHTWNWTTKTWELDMAQAKTQAWSRIKQARFATLTAPLATPHGTFDCDPGSQSNIMKAALDAKTRHELGLPSDVEFTLADNTRPTFTWQHMLEVALSMGEREKWAYATAQALREQIDAATTLEQLEAIQWPESP